MTEDTSNEIKAEIFRLISIPGLEVEEIPDRINIIFNIEIDHEEVMQILSDEYLKHNLDYGRRLCCKF